MFKLFSLANFSKMSRFEHTSIFQSAYGLTVEIYRATKNFSKEHKYTLGERLKNITHEILDLVMKTNAMEGKEKLSGIAALDYKKEALRIHLRLAFELKALSGGQLGIFNEKLEEIGKQLGGWRKWAEHGK